MKKIRVTAVLLVLFLTAMLTACGGQTASNVGDSTTANVEDSTTSSNGTEPENTSPASDTTNVSTSPSSVENSVSAIPGEAAVAAIVAGDISREKQLPLTESPETLTMWKTTNFSTTDPITSQNDNEGVKWVAEQTNVTIDFVECNMTVANEQFNLIIATGSTPDIIDTFENYYSKGVESAIDEDIIIDLLDYIEYAPIYQSLLDTDPALLNRCAPSGKLGSFYSILTDYSWVQNSTGIRADWLDELGLEIPTTFDECHDVLMAFKDAYDPEYCLNIGSNLGYGWFQSGSGIAVNPSAGTMFYLDGDTVSDSFTSEQFETYLAMLHDWYMDGLISPDFVTFGDLEFFEADFSARVAGGDVALFNAPAGLIPEFRSMSNDEDFSVAPVPVLRYTTDQDLCNITPSSLIYSANGAISTNCSNIPLAMAYLDYWYTEDGSNVSTFGVEGVSWEYDADGNVQYTELLTDNPNYELRAMKDMYSITMNRIFDINDDFRLTWDTEACEMMQFWAEDQLVLSQGDGNTYFPENELTLEQAQMERVAELKSDIMTYVSTEIPEFIMGVQDMSEFELFCETLQEMGIEELVSIYQVAYDQYIA